MPENPLQWVSDDDLIEELKTRFDVIVVVTAKDHPHEDSTVYNSHGKGPLHTIFGLMELYKARETHKYLLYSRDVEDDEEI